MWGTRHVGGNAVTKQSKFEEEKMLTHAHTQRLRNLGNGGDGNGPRDGGRLGRRTLLELGCGVGNAVFPLLEENRGLYVIAADLSSRGIDLLKQHPMYT